METLTDALNSVYLGQSARKIIFGRDLWTGEFFVDISVEEFGDRRYMICASSISALKDQAEILLNRINESAIYRKAFGEYKELRQAWIDVLTDVCYDLDILIRKS